MVNTGDHEKYSRTLKSQVQVNSMYRFFVNFLIIIIYNNMYLCPSLPQAAQSEYHSPFIFLDNLQQLDI